MKRNVKLCQNHQRRRQRRFTRREERVQGLMEELKEKHGATFTPMQYRIWCEMFVGGIYSSVDEPPSSSMFRKDGKGESSDKKKGEGSTVAEALSQLPLLFPRHSHHVRQTQRAMPLQVIESRSKCYKQLSDLNNLGIWCLHRGRVCC